MATIYVKKLRETFKQFGIQLPATTINMIDDHFERQIYKMAIRCKDGNVKRLTPELFWVALGNNQPDTEI